MGVKKLKQNLKAKLELEGHTFDLPLIVGTEGEKAIDISKLRSETGYVTLDPAFVNTASCDSKITYLDGENGILRYRGYPIQELAEKASFTEVAFLLIHGELPSKKELDQFNSKIAKYSEQTATVKNMLPAFRSPSSCALHCAHTLRFQQQPQQDGGHSQKHIQQQ